MSEKQSNKERIKEITAGIEKGIMELFESDRYRNYLTTMSRFHRYSLNDVMLIHAQKPNATAVSEPRTICHDMPPNSTACQDDSQLVLLIYYFCLKSHIAPT